MPVLLFILLVLHFVLSKRVVLLLGRIPVLPA